MEILPVISTDGSSIPISYAIYPSLLDAFLRYKKHDDDETFDSLLDRINKTKHEQTESQLKGVEFESTINEELAVQKLGFVDSMYQRKEGLINGFKIETVDELVRRLMHNTGAQKYMEVIIHTHLGNIKLYGIVDYEFPDMIVDLKGTDNYKCNKYKDSTQHPVYSLIRHLKGTPIKQFKYLVSDYENVFQETYIPSQNMYDKLMLIIFEFIAFIERYKANITDMKVFGGREALA